LSPEQIFQCFLLGLLAPDINAADISMLWDAPPVTGVAGRSEISLSIHTDYGPIDPVLVFDQLLRGGSRANFESYVASSAFASIFKWDLTGNYMDGRRYGEICTSINVNQFLSNNVCGIHLYPFSYLILCKSKFDLGDEDQKWREIGDKQKQQYKTMIGNLRGRDPSEINKFFNWEDRLNPFQLEAIIESFCYDGLSQDLEPCVTGTEHPANPTVLVSCDFTDGEHVDPVLDPGKTSHLYLVQIDPLFDIGGPRTHAKIRTSRETLAGEVLYDYYEGAMFVVYKGRVRKIFPRFSSFTSKNNLFDALSSIEGNRRYRFRSRVAPFRGDKKGHNYAFAITPSNDISKLWPLHAWYYWGYPLDWDHFIKEPGAIDTNGKGFIIIHRGNRIGSTMYWNGSEGCQVSPYKVHYDLRSLIVDIWLEYKASESEMAPIERLQLVRIRDSDMDTSEWAWQETKDHLEYEEYLKELIKTITPEFAKKLKELNQIGFEADIASGKVVPANYWDHKIYGTYYLVRPFEQNVSGLPDCRRMIVRP
jgi:hypothetical protein